MWGLGLLCLIIPAISSSQEATKSAKKPELIELQVKVADKKEGSPIDDADVKVMKRIRPLDWGSEPGPRFQQRIVSPQRLSLPVAWVPEIPDQQGTDR